MCEFCESTKANQIMRYDNRKNMSVSFGQYKGVKVDSAVKMQGNMLLLSGWGSYRSDFDCYYESAGLDIDDERGARSNDAYIKIEYCPFCGRKLTSTLYEQTKAQDDIYDLKRKLENLEADLEEEQLFVYLHWFPKGSIFNDKGEIDFEASVKNPEFDKRDYKHDLTLLEIDKLYTNLKVNIYYGTKKLGKDRRSYRKYKRLTLDEKIWCNSYCMGEFSTGGYALPEDVYKKLVEMNYIIYNQNELDELHKRQNKIKEDIKQIKKKINDLKKYIKELK